MDQSKIPSWIGSVALHAAVILALIYVSFGPKLPPPITGVPVTLVTSGPPASVQPEPTPAAQETAPPAPPEPTPAPPTPQPVPAPAKETPKPQPQAKPPAPAPTKAGKTKPTPPQKPQDSAPDVLGVAKNVFGGHAAPAPRKLPPGPSAGPPRVAPTASQSGAALKGLVDKMGRLWNFDCSIAGNREAVIPIHFVIATNGRFSDGPTVVSGGSSLFAGAAPSAVRALKAGEPYSTDEVPAEYRNQGITLNFHAKDACRGK